MKICCCGCKKLTPAVQHGGGGVMTWAFLFAVIESTMNSTLYNKVFLSHMGFHLSVCSNFFFFFKLTTYYFYFLHWLVLFFYCLVCSSVGKITIMHYVGLVQYRVWCSQSV